MSLATVCLTNYEHHIILKIVVNPTSFIFKKLIVFKKCNSYYFTEQVGLVVMLLTNIQNVLGSDLAWTPTIRTEIVHDLPQSLQPNVG
jgi:hypothetical protein